MAPAPESAVEVRTGDGLTLRGRAWTGSDPLPRRVLLLVHGLKDHGGRYAALAGALTATGTAVVAFDLRGHGRSDGDRAFVRRFAEFGTDLALARAFVAERFPNVPMALLGHSLGGAIAAREVLDHPSGVNALVLSAPAFLPPASASASAQGVVRLLARLAPHARVYRLDPSDFCRAPSEVEALERDPWIDPRPVPARTAAELLSAMPPLRSDARRLQTPTLVLHGTADRVTNPEGSAGFARAAPVGTVELRSVPGAYHDLWHEPEASALRATVAGWLARDAEPG